MGELGNGEGEGLRDSLNSAAIGGHLRLGPQQRESIRQKQEKKKKKKGAKDDVIRALRGEKGCV